MREPALRDHLWLKLAVMLALFGGWVSWWFVPRRLVPVHDLPYRVLRDRSDGRNIGLLFELLPGRAARTDLVVVIIGDSTVKAGTTDFFGASGIPSLLRDEIARAFPGRSVGVIDLSQAGLYAPDALLFAAKAFALAPDLVIYALGPRVVPSEPDVPWATSVADLALEPDIVGRLGIVEVLRLIGPRAIGRTLVHSYYPPVRLRTELANDFWNALRVRLPSSAWPVVRRIAARPQVGSQPLARAAVGEEGELPPEPALPSGAARGAYLWPASRYRLEPPTRATRALDTLFDLCRREGRCLLYHGPVNPVAAERFEPGLLDAFTAHVQARADAHGVPLLDYHRLGEPTWFRTDLAGKPDAIHLSASGRKRFATELAAAVIGRLRELGR